MKTLKLTLHRAAFEVMVTGEKTREFRANSAWIRSRLWSRDKKIKDLKVFDPRDYDFIEFTNGYGSDKPFFKAKFIDFLENVEPFMVRYSNGLVVKVESRDLIIRIGEIVEIKNYELSVGQKMAIAGRKASKAASDLTETLNKLKKNDLPQSKSDFHK